MLHTLLGEQGFQKGMQLYIAENDGKAATCEDFLCLQWNMRMMLI